MYIVGYFPGVVKGLGLDAAPTPITRILYSIISQDHADANTVKLE